MLAPTAGHEKDEAMHDGEALTLADTMMMKVGAPVVFLAACQTGQSTRSERQPVVGEHGAEWAMTC